MAKTSETSSDSISEAKDLRFKIKSIRSLSAKSIKTYMPRALPTVRTGA